MEIVTVLSRLTERLTSTKRLDDAADLVLEHARQLTRSEFVFVGYNDPDTGGLKSPRLLPNKWEIYQSADKGITFGRAAGWFQWALMGHQPVLVNAPARDERFAGLAPGSLPDRFMAAPARADGQVLGCIIVAEAGGDYCQEDLHLLELLASLYGLAIQRQRAEAVQYLLTKQLQERVKGPYSLYHIYSLAGRQGARLDEILQEIVEIIPQTLRHSGGMCARIVLGEKRFKSANYTALEYKHCSQVYVDGKAVGQVEVGYAGPHPGDRAVFLLESEEIMLQAIAERIGETVERLRAEQALHRYADEQAALYKVTAMASSFLHPQQLLSNILDIVMALPEIDADAGWILLGEAPWDSTVSVGAARNVPEAFLQAEVSSALRNCQMCVDLLAGKEPPEQPRLVAACPQLPSHILAETGIESHISIPLKVSHRVLGIIHLGWRQSHAYRPEDRRLLMAIGHQVALALRNAQLYQAAMHVDRLKLINDIGTAASSSLELEVALRQVVEMTCRALGAERGSILLRQAQTGDLVFTVAYPPERDNLEGKRIQVGHGIASWAAEHGQIVHVPDVRQDDRRDGVVLQQMGFEPHSVLCAPLPYHGEITGVIEVFDKQRVEFSEEDAQLLEAVAAITAATLENARLYAAMRHRAEKLELLNEVGLALTRNLNSAAVVDDALARVEQLFQAKYVGLLKPDAQTGELVFVKALAGAQEQQIVLRLQAGEGIAGWVQVNRQALYVEDARVDTRFCPRVDDRTGVQTRSVMAVPLLSTDQVIGVLEVISEQPGVYGENDLRTLQSLGATLAVALDNARLYEDLKQLLVERERAQAQLIQSEKMSALGRLAASVAHEINNPLQAVQTCLTLVSEEMDGAQRQDRMRRYLGTVDSEIERIAVIVRRMRDFYRPARAGLHPTEIVPVLESVLDLTAKRLQHDDIALERVFSRDLPTIQSNADQLKQVFLNLVLNAADAMPTGGKLRVVVSWAPIRPEGIHLPGPALMIEFSDTGIGITPESLKHIFEPFVTTKDQGTGLGLYISYGIIQSLHGYIDVNSTVGQGTTFSIWLPADQPKGA